MTRWYCPNCNESAFTQNSDKMPMHQCRGLAGLMVPLIKEGTKAKVERVEREDYIGDEDVQFDGEGKPTMSVVTTRDDGQDCVIFAPSANIGVKGEDL